MKKVLLLCAALSVGACTDSETDTKEMKIATPQPPVVVNKVETDPTKESEDKYWEEMNKNGAARNGIWDGVKRNVTDADGRNF